MDEVTEKIKIEENYGKLQPHRKHSIIILHGYFAKNADYHTAIDGRLLREHDVGQVFLRLSERVKHYKKKHFCLASK